MDANLYPTDEELTPAYRAKKLRAAMEELYDEAAPDDALTDLLADARHFADAHGLDFGEADRKAHDHYCGELGWTRHSETVSRPLPKQEKCPGSVEHVMSSDYRAFIDQLAPTFDMEPGEIAGLSDLANLVADHEAAGLCLIVHVDGKQVFLSSADVKAMITNEGDHVGSLPALTVD